MVGKTVLVEYNRTMLEVAQGYIVLISNLTNVRIYMKNSTLHIESLFMDVLAEANIGNWKNLNKPRVKIHVLLTIKVNVHRDIKEAL